MILGTSLALELIYSIHGSLKFVCTSCVWFDVYRLRFRGYFSSPEPPFHSFTRHFIPFHVISTLCTLGMVVCVHMLSIGLLSLGFLSFTSKLYSSGVRIQARVDICNACVSLLCIIAMY